MAFGVDEAGKGPVLGSMFAAAVAGDPDALPDGIADSKTLSPGRRRELAAQIRSVPKIETGLAEISVSTIDDPGTDMNELTVIAHARAIEAAGMTEGTGHVDAGDVDADRFGRRVESRVEGELTVQAEHAADERYPLVGAASILAKVARDAHIEDLGAAYDDPIGSGYPSDERTRTFLQNYVERTGELPACARRSWQTSEDILDTVAQQSLDEF